MKIQVMGESFELLPQRALHWPRQKLLALSDVHLGKAESFQKQGVPMPTDHGEIDLATLRELIHRYHPQDILILGDLIHQSSSWTEILFQKIYSFLKEFQQASVGLILGNHEYGSRSFLEQLPLTLFYNNIRQGTFEWSHGHKKNTTDGVFQIQGHQHPIITLREGPLKMRLPCFDLSEDQLILPSFGYTTGGVEVRRKNKHRYFAVAPQEVFEVR